MSKQVQEATGANESLSDALVGSIGGPLETFTVAKAIRQDRKKNEERAPRELFESITRLIAQGGGNIPSKVAETATSVRSAKGSEVQRRRKRSGFVIPKERKRSITGGGVGLSLSSPTKGLSLVI